jgi:probable HAF family extracellular repeat protein
MASTACTSLGRRLRLAVAGAAVATALTVATAAASPPTPMGVQAAGLSRLEVSDFGSGLDAGLRTRSDSGSGPRSPFPAFLLDRGRYTTFEAPDPEVRLIPYGINNRGVIVGEYIRVGPDGLPDSESGFLRDRRGRFSVFDLPGAKGTEVVRINDRGQLVGEYSQDTPIVNDSARVRAYLWDRGKLTRIDAPGAVVTNAVGVNNRAQVVGAYWEDDGTAHGYLWERGRMTTIDVAGAAATQPLAINDRGQVVGNYFDDLTLRPGTVHGYLLDRGKVTRIDAPDAPVTLPYDINNRGQIVGSTLAPTQEDPLAGARGFLLAKGATGPFTPVGFPGAPRSVANGLNDRGQIVGRYENPNATPSPQRDAMPPMGRMA